MKTKEEILDEVHKTERMSANMEDSYVLKRVALQAMSEVEQQTRDEMLLFTKWFYSEYRQELTLQTNDDPLIYGFNNQYKVNGTIKELFEYWQLNIKEKP